MGKSRFTTVCRKRSKIWKVWQRRVVVLEILHIFSRLTKSLSLNLNGKSPPSPDFSPRHRLPRPKEVSLQKTDKQFCVLTLDTNLNHIAVNDEEWPAKKNAIILIYRNNE